MLSVIAVANATTAAADELRVPAHIQNRQQPIAAVYHLDTPATGRARLEIEWSDTENRIVERRAIETVLTRGREVKFALDARRAVTIRNALHVRFSLDSSGVGGKKEHRESDARATFTVAPSERGWSDYQIIMWHERTADQLAALKRLGVSAGKVNGNRIEMANIFMTKQAEPLLQSNLPWYVENIATDFYSAYHRWFPDHPENWRFLEAKQRYREDPTSTAAFFRDPSLSDPVWLRTIRDRLMATVRLHRPYRPLYYNLGDEPGVQDLASFWDFDLSEPSLQQMRLWLRHRYLSLATLNREWGAHFESWDAVTPMTTREAMQRPDENYAAWADFKEWMDVAFARALRTGTNAVHAADPEALAAIEGAQIPGWGGYNYAHLAQAVDLMEIYDFAGNIDIVRSLNPKMILLNTSGGGGAQEEHQIWRELLRGSRGLILWDEKSDLVRADGSLGSWGQSIGPLFHTLRGGVGALLINSERDTDPVAVLYSPASMRTQWMLDQKPKGDAWIERNADAEYQDNAFRASTRHFTEGFDKLGVQYRFITSALIEHGALRGGRYTVLILPHAIALSRDAAAAIRRFFREGGVVIADDEPGSFDEHSRRLTTPLLADLFPAGATPNPSSVSLGKGRAIYLAPPISVSSPDGKACPERMALQPLARVLKAAGLSSVLDVATPEGEPATDVQTYVYRNGDVTVIALQEEACTPPSAPVSAAPDGKKSFDLILRRSGYLYDVRAHKFLGRRRRLEFELDRTAPTILAFSPRPLSLPSVRQPKRMHLGESAMLRFHVSGSAPTAKRVLHVDVIDPGGKSIDYYSGNIVAAGGVAVKRLSLALNDPVGNWQIQVTDVLSGATQSSTLIVIAP